MHVKTLIVALLGISAAVEAVEFGGRSTRALEQRQQNVKQAGGGRKNNNGKQNGVNQNGGAVGANRNGGIQNGGGNNNGGGGNNNDDDDIGGIQNGGGNDNGGGGNNNDDDDIGGIQNGGGNDNGGGGGGNNNNGGGGNNNGGNNNGGNNNGGNNNGGNNNNGAALNPNVIQSASTSDGILDNNGGEEGLARSATSDNNFINFCADQNLDSTNGQQIAAGSCNSIPHGQIPSIDNMVSSLITSPRNGDTLGANQAFQIRVQMRNIVTGQFTNATSTYYSAPQQLDKSGRIFGHTHFSLQQLENQNQAPNPRVFTFFKGVNDPAQAGLLTADVEKGLSPGTYRVCSMASSSNHQPVMMPVAQRGAQDDCIRFNVAGQGGQQRNNAQGGQQRNNAQGGQRNQVANQRKPVQGGQRSQVVNQGLRGQNGLNRRV